MTKLCQIVNIKYLKNLASIANDNTFLHNETFFVVENMALLDSCNLINKTTLNPNFFLTNIYFALSH